MKKHNIFPAAVTCCRDLRRQTRNFLLLAMPMLGINLGIAAVPLKTLVLQQGAVPALDGQPIAGAAVYTNAVDTYVDRTTPTTAYGHAETLEFFRHDMNSNDTQHAYIRFENFAEHLPPGAVIVAARLKLLGTGEGLTGGKRGQIGIMTVNWSTNMTWNTGRVETRINHGYAGWDGVWASNTWVQIDLTSAARAWHSGELANYGLILRSMADSSFYKQRRAFSSKAPNVANRPVFEIDYIVPGKSWENGKPIRLDVVVTNGPAIIEDTVIYGSRGTTPPGLYATNNYASLNFADVRTYNDPKQPQRALLRLKLDNPVLNGIAKTTDRGIGFAELQSAWLDFSILGCDRSRYLHIWRMDPAQDWDVNTVTAATRDGITPWAQPMTNEVIGNVINPYLYRSDHGIILEAGTEHLYITQALQFFLDGTNNTGFAVGHSGISSAAYEHQIGLTEQSYRFLRPTLVFVTRTYLQQGSVIIVQ